MHIIATSDLHGALPEIEPCDLLLIGGDLPPVNGSHHPADQTQWAKETFAEWIAALPTERVILVAGNHDFWLETEEGKAAVEEIPKLTYLEDSGTEVDGLTIYGTPWTPNLPGWAFQKEGDEARLAFANIPRNTDILLSHGPLAGRGDLVGNRITGYEYCGSKELRENVATQRVRTVVCGHIHEGYGQYTLRYEGRETNIYNVAHMDAIYRPINPPVVIEPL